jgi:hypothetical protein
MVCRHLHAVGRLIVNSSGTNNKIDLCGEGLGFFKDCFYLVSVLKSCPKTSQQAFREAADAINAHVKTGEIAARQNNLVESYRKVARVATDRFQGGASGYLEVLDAERSLFSAELEQADARRNRLLSVVFAYRALGGGWQ